MILYESENAKIEWLEKDKVVIKTFQGFVTGDDLKDAFKSGLFKMKDSGGVKWLSDNRGLPTYKTEDAEWINNQWFPRMLQIGWKYWALVEPASNVGRLAMKKFKHYTDNGVVVEKFSAMGDALSWLRNQK